jgi:uncharacterized surface protein with fasciclin (FAS1) repeats
VKRQNELFLQLRVYSVRPEEKDITMTKFPIKSLIGASAFALAAACSGNSTDNTAYTPEASETMTMPDPVVGDDVETVTVTVVDIAVSDANFSTLVTAVTEADLAETLSGDGPFTVFAPTNAAFDALPDGTVETLLKDENKTMLQSILTYHVVSGNISASDLITMINNNGGSAEVTTVQGGTLTATLMGGEVRLEDEKGNSATVTATDMAASNGVVHVIDTVVMPDA